MKILYLTDQTYLHGGIEKVLSQKANYLADVAGDQVIICTYNQRENKPCYPFSDKIIFVNLEINYELGKSFFHISNIRKLKLHWRKLNDLCKDIQPDVIISSSFGIDLYFIPFLATRIPKIKEYHATRFFMSKEKGFKNLIRNFTLHFIEKRYSKVVILNRDEVQFYKSNNVTIIPNPAEIGRVRADLKNKKIIAAGRIIFQKNFQDLIQIGKKICNDYPEWEIHIYGEDYQGRKEILQEMIYSLSLEKNILFMGATDDLKKTMLSYSIFALTSQYETFPMVLLESLSVGLPVISYDCPTGPRNILTDKEDSFIVPNQNTDAFVEKLEVLMNDEDLRTRMGSSAIKNVQRFGIGEVMEMWRRLFVTLTESEKVLKND